MVKNDKMRLRRIYKILLSASIIVTGFMLIISCCSIYFSGNGYSHEIVARIFSKINIPVYLCLALIIVDTIWELISPSTAKAKVFNKKSVSTTNSPTSKKLNITRFIILGIAIITLVLGAVFGGYSDVLTKAINICTECIGLG